MKFCLFFISAIATGFAADDLSYSEQNQGYASFDISMPIDATGYTLHGHNLQGGPVQFTNQCSFISEFLSSEKGKFALPVSTDLDNKPLIKTTVDYSAVKFVNQIGIRNLFIKIGVASRTQIVSGLDPTILKDGTYTWDVPIFAFGTENNNIDDQSENMQFMQIGTSDGDPSKHNGMYTQEFYLYMQGQGTHAIVGHPQKTDRSNEKLAKGYTTKFTCCAEGIWGAGGSDPYRTITGECKGKTVTFPAGPNLDYEYGTFTLPTVHTPWSATPSDHCIVEDQQRAGCVNATIDSEFHFMAQKIRVPIDPSFCLYAEFGSAYRSVMPKNLRYQCESNQYLTHLLPKASCLQKSYLPGGSEYPYFAVGYAFRAEDGTRYTARYIYLPEQENGNRLQWLDASATRIYAISVSGVKNTKPSPETMTKQWNAILERIRTIPAVYEILGEHFFAAILKKNNIQIFDESEK